MNCYEIKISVFIEYEDGDDRYDFRDPRCDRWTVRDVITATAFAWAENKDRAMNLVDTLNFGPYDVTDYKVDSIMLIGPEPDAEEEEIELINMKTPFDQ